MTSKQSSRVDELEQALAMACDVAIWLSGLPCLRESEAWQTWEGDMRPRLFAALDARRETPNQESSDA